MKKQIVDIVYGFVAFLFSVFCFAYLIPMQIRVRKAYMADASIFPQLAALLIGVAGLALVITRIWALPDKRVLLDKTCYAINGKIVLRQVVFIVAMVAYLKLMPMLGFVLASTLFAFTMLHYFGSRTLAKNAVISVVFSVAVYLLFSRLFQVVLAPGPLPF